MMIHLVVDPNQKRLNEEMQTVELQLGDQYQSHIDHVQALNNIQEAEVLRLKAVLDKQTDRNDQKERELVHLQEVWGELRKSQEDVVPVSLRMRPNTTATSLRANTKVVTSTTDLDFIPILLERIATLERETNEVENNCLMRETESERILQMLSIEKQTTLILRERMQEAKELHRRLLKRYESVLQTKFVAKNHLVIAENEVVKQKVNNEDLKRRFREGMYLQSELKRSTVQKIQESIEKISLKSIELRSKQQAKMDIIHDVEHKLDDFVSTRRRLLVNESKLEAYKQSFATIMR